MAAMDFTARAARPSEFAAVLRLSVDAFNDEAVLVWTMPGPTVRRRRTRDLFEDSLRASVAAGDLVIAVTSDAEPVAASLWHALDTDHGSVRSAEPDGARAPSDPVSHRLHAVAQATAARHPTDPHLFLSSMATLPEHRGRGAGAVMVRFGIDRARERALPIYLEASTPQNRRLYLRHGFADQGGPIELPDDGPVLQPMWRAVGT